MDADISAVFCPCGHAVACSSCALRCTACPVCRATTTHTQTIFLPLSASSLAADSSFHGTRYQLIKILNSFSISILFFLTEAAHLAESIEA